MGRGEKMNENTTANDFKRFENVLLEFIERVSKGNAAPEEIAALPEVAKVWLTAQRINLDCIPHLYHYVQAR